MKSIICTLAVLILTLILAGCGQSGPLYVPGDPSSINVQPEAQPSDEEGDENGENGENGQNGQNGQNGKNGEDHDSP